MPQLDKTGPEGMGPTGLRQGGCTQTQRRSRRFTGGFCGLNRWFVNRNAMTLKEEETLLTERLNEVRKAMKEQAQE